MAVLRFTILGCGSSGGVPRIGGHWGDCDPDNPKNRRLRCSMLVERIEDGQTTRVLIDTSPDLREQLLRAGVGHLDAVIYTHSHADHVHGIDDLRQLVFNARRRLPVWADDIRRRYLRGESTQFVLFGNVHDLILDDPDGQIDKRSPDEKLLTLYDLALTRTEDGI